MQAIIYQVLSIVCCIVPQCRMCSVARSLTTLETLHHMSGVSPMVEKLEVGCDLNGPGQVTIVLS